MVLGLVAGIAAAVLFGTAAVLQAHAVRQLPHGLRSLRGFVADAVRHPLILVVVAAYLGGFVLHAVAIWLLPLYLAQASIALSLPISALAARRVSEHATLRQVGLGRRGGRGAVPARGRGGCSGRGPRLRHLRHRAVRRHRGAARGCRARRRPAGRVVRHPVGARLRRLGTRGARGDLARHLTGPAGGPHGVGVRTGRLLALLHRAGPRQRQRGDRADDRRPDGGAGRPGAGRAR